MYMYIIIYTCRSPLISLETYYNYIYIHTYDPSVVEHFILGTFTEFAKWFTTKAPKPTESQL